MSSWLLCSIHWNSYLLQRLVSMILKYVDYNTCDICIDTHLQCICPQLKCTHGILDLILSCSLYLNVFEVHVTQFISLTSVCKLFVIIYTKFIAAVRTCMMPLFLRMLFHDVWWMYMVVQYCIHLSLISCNIVGYGLFHFSDFVLSQVTTSTMAMPPVIAGSIALLPIIVTGTATLVGRIQSPCDGQRLSPQSLIEIRGCGCS